MDAHDRATTDFDAAWNALPAPFQRALECAYESLGRGSLAIGACLTDVRGEVVAAARNSTNENKGAGRLAGSPIAHAEMSLLAERSHNEDFTGWAIWGTHRPCLMCAAAMEFVGLHSATYLAEDPISRFSRAKTAYERRATLAPWGTVANVLLARSLVLLPEEKRKQEAMVRTAIEATQLAAQIWPDQDGIDQRGLHEVLRTWWTDIIEVDKAVQRARDSPCHVG